MGEVDLNGFSLIGCTGVLRASLNITNLKTKLIGGTNWRMAHHKNEFCNIILNDV